MNANRLCSLTGVRPQTRESWVRRGLLRKAAAYGQLDLIEQAVVKALLRTIPKGDVDFVWHEVRPALRDRIPDVRVSLVWDPEARTAAVTSTDEELADSVRHGRPVYVLPLGELVKASRDSYAAEMAGVRRATQARDQAAQLSTASSATQQKKAPP